MRMVCMIVFSLVLLILIRELNFANLRYERTLSSR